MQKDNPIAKFNPTLNLREGLKPEDGGIWGIVQAKDVGYDGKLDLSKVSRVKDLHLNLEPLLLQLNDIILQSRGTSYRSGIVPEGASNLVAASGVYALRPHTERVDPHYLVMFFNLPTTQQSLRQIATGSHILNLRRDALNGFLDQMAIALPPLAEQKRLVALGETIRRAHLIETRLNELRLRHLEALIARKAHAPPAESKQVERHEGVIK